MAHADDLPPNAPAGKTSPTRRRAPWATGMICVTILPLLGFIGQTGRTLWGEWSGLRGDRVSARNAAVIGYISINPNPNYAARPRDWKRDVGEQSLLWSGWADGENRWFRFGRGELDGLRLSYPLGRDMIQVIDRPIFQREGDAIWVKVPDEARVAHLDLGEGSAAFPFRVLDKVEVINGLIADRPILVAYTPEVEEVAIYEATLDGRRVTMGHSGFFEGHDPVLYDRASESLWVAREGDLAAVAGRRKGARLRRIARAEAVTWASWKADHPEGMLLVGADRSGHKPAE